MKDTIKHSSRDIDEQKGNQSVMTTGRLALPDGCAVPDNVRMLHSLLSGWFDETFREVPEERWPGIRELAMSTKTVGLVSKWVASNPGLQPDFERIRAAILQQNMRNIAWMIRTQGLLQSGEIPALFFKGTVRSTEVYGALDCRPSNDVDILVRPSDYLAACALLQSEGYRPQVSSKSVWWHSCLGEAPFRNEEKNSPYIDLHHQLQQPGGPYPLNLNQFFEASTRKSFGKVEIATPSPGHAQLIAIINYGKAMRAGEPTIGRLHELSFAIRKSDGAASQELLDLASGQGLENLAKDALRRALILFPHDGSKPDRHPEFETELSMSLSMVPGRIFARTRMLWSWSDGTLGPRAGRFATSVARVAASDLWRWFECRIGRIG